MLLSSCSQVNEGEYPDLENMKVVEMSQQEIMDYMDEASLNMENTLLLKVDMDMDYEYTQMSFVGDIWSGYYDTVNTTHRMSGQFESAAYFKINDEDNELEEVNASITFDMNMYQRSEGETLDMDYNADLNIYLLDETMYMDTNLATSIEGVNTEISSKQKMDIEDTTTEFIDNEALTQDTFGEFESATMYKKGSVDYIELSFDQEAFDALDLTDITDLGSIIELDRFLTGNIGEFNMSYVLAFKDNKVIQSGFRLSITLNDENQSYVEMTVVIDMVDEMPEFPDDFDSYNKINSIEDILSGFIE